MTVRGEYFCGNKISEYGRKNGYVDYGTLAEAFDAVLANDLMNCTRDIGYWEMETDGVDYDRLTEINEELFDLEGMLYDGMPEDEENRIRDRIAELEDEEEELNQEPDVYQWYIVSDAGAELLKEAGEIVYYNEELNLHLWGVTHWGTSWSYVLTNIRIEGDD